MSDTVTAGTAVNSGSNNGVVTQSDQTQVQSGTQTATPITVGGKQYASVDELSKAYESLQSEHGKWTSEAGRLKEQYEQVSAQAKQWGDWWKTIQPLWGDDVEGLLRQKLTGQRQPQQTQQTQQQQQAAQIMTEAAKWAEGFELLRPEEQAHKIQQVVAGELSGQFQNALKQLDDAWRQSFAQKEQYYQTYMNNHLSLMRQALEEKIRNPQFDVDKVMATAAQAISGQMDPIQLGQQLLAAAQMNERLEASKKEAYAQGKKDYEQELANKKQESVPMVTTSTPQYKFPAREGQQNGRRNGFGAGDRERAAEAIVKKFGPGWFNG